MNDFRIWAAQLLSFRCKDFVIKGQQWDGIKLKQVSKADLF